MDWYYGVAGEQKGPVAEDELAGLRQAGTITDSTLVWCQGMAGWQPYLEIFSGKPAAQVGTPALRLAGAPPEPTPAYGEATAGRAICRECGGSFSAEDVLNFDGAIVCAGCKPIYLQRLREGVTAGDAEQIRQDHIKHEASVKSVGILYLIGGAVALAAALMFFVGVGATGGGGQDMVLTGTVAVVFLLLGGFQIAAGLALRRLRGWARIAAGILSGIGLLGFPMGTLINGYILYLLFSQKGRMVFSEEYRQIIAQTPHVKYRTSILVWIFLGILLLFIAAALVTAVFGVRR